MVNHEHEGGDKGHKPDAIKEVHHEIAQQQWNTNMREVTQVDNNTQQGDHMPTHVAQLKTQLRTSPQETLDAVHQRTKDIEDAIAKNDMGALRKLADDHAKEMKAWSDLVAYNTGAVGRHQEQSNGFEIVGA